MTYASKLWHKSGSLNAGKIDSMRGGPRGLNCVAQLENRDIFIHPQVEFGKSN